ALRAHVRRGELPGGGVDRLSEPTVRIRCRRARRDVPVLDLGAAGADRDELLAAVRAVLLLDQRLVDRVPERLRPGSAAVRLVEDACSDALEAVAAAAG